MVFDRRNKFIKTNVALNGTLIGEVKRFKGLGFTISGNKLLFSTNN